MATIDKFLENENNNNDQTQEVEITSKPNNIFINADFDEGIVEIGYVFLATNEQNIVKISMVELICFREECIIFQLIIQLLIQIIIILKFIVILRTELMLDLLKMDLHVLYRSDTMLY